MLYAARKRQSDPKIALPALPDSFLGWIPALYRITEEQVLASAGLDAFVVRSIAREKSYNFAYISTVPVVLQDVAPPVCGYVVLRRRCPFAYS